MPLLIAEPQAQLEVVFGAAGDLVTADRPDAEPRGRPDRLSCTDQQG
jgi:hypothetical protein